MTETAVHLEHAALVFSEHQCSFRNKSISKYSIFVKGFESLPKGFPTHDMRVGVLVLTCPVIDRLPVQGVVCLYIAVLQFQCKMYHFPVNSNYFIY